MLLWVVRLIQHIWWCLEVLVYVKWKTYLSLIVL